MSITIDHKRYSNELASDSMLRLFFGSPGFRFMVLFRACQKYSSRHPVGIITRFWYKRLQVKFGYQIPHTCRIGSGLYLGHYGNIVINQKAVIGENCNIAQGVTVGVVNRGNKKGCPAIGNRVWIGANAVLVGNIRIGDDVLIAPLSYVTEDVPDRAVVAGNPAKVINLNSSEGYVNNVVP